jgi:import receptor subunit TOM20
MPSLGSVLGAGLLALVSTGLGYAIYFDYKRRHDVTFRRKLKKDMKYMEKLVKEEDATATLATEEDIIQGEHGTTASISMGKESSPAFDLSGVDLPLEQILEKPGTDREKLFYGLLIRGEELVSSKVETEVETGIQYFYKALCLLPNPAELLSILQSTLPGEVFQKLVQLIGDTSVRRVITYLKAIMPSESSIQIRPVVSKNPVTGVEMDTPGFSIFATKDFSKGDIIYQESPILSASLTPLESASETSDCHHCHASVANQTGISFSCGKCPVVYCSETCQNVAGESYHLLLCQGRNPSKALAPLLSYAETKPYILLILRFLAAVFAEQAKVQHGTALTTQYDPMEGVIVHFEYMKMFPQNVEPSAIDEKEAGLIRDLFSEILQDFSGTLPTQKYMAIKYRILSTCIPFSITGSDPALHLQPIDVSEPTSNEKSVEVSVSKLDSGSSHIGLFKCSGHLTQSSKPNVGIALSLNPNFISRTTVSVVASCDIAQGEELSMDYFPLSTGLVSERCATIKN